MAEELITKGGVERDPINQYTISSTRIIKHLMETILGVDHGVKVQFRRFTGVSPDESYVSMRALFAPDIIVKSETPKYAGDRILAQFSSDTRIRADFLESLKPFMYPDINMNDSYNLQRLYTLGLGGENLNEVQRYNKLSYDPNENCFGILLQPDLIVGDILADPDGKKRNWYIDSVEGTTSETIKFICKIDLGMNTVINSNMSFDAFFKNN